MAIGLLGTLDTKGLEVAFVRHHCCALFLAMLASRAARA